MMDRGRDWKALTVPLAAIQAASTDERCYVLSDQAVAALLAMAAYLHWPTRWNKPLDLPLTTEEKDFVDALAAYVESRLMDPNFCSGEDVMDVRQNIENPCLLEKSFDGGASWEVFADLQLCMPALRRDPLTGRYQWGTEDIGFYDFPDGPWVDNAPETTYSTPLARTTGTESEQTCEAAANAAYVLRQVYTGVGNNLVDSVLETDFERASAIGFYLEGALAVLGAPLLAPAVAIAAILGLLGVTNHANANPLDDDDEERLKCILLDNATNTDGVVTFDFNAVWGAIDLDSPKNDVVRIILTSIRADALNFAGTREFVTGDCDPCGGDCTYYEPMTTALKATTDVNGVIHPGNGGTIGTYNASGGRTSGGRIAAEGDGTNQRINVLLDMGEECVINDSSVWLKVDYDPGAFVHLEWYYYAADGGLTGHGSLYNPAGWPLDWTQYFSVGTTNPTRYVVIDLWSDGSSVFSIDDIKVNLDEDHEF